MGFLVRSIYSISLNDTHLFFIYFLPTRSFRYEWINQWVHDQFPRITEAVGAHNGVMIVPSPTNEEKYWASILEIPSLSRAIASALGSTINENVVNEQFRSAPLLILSRAPLSEKTVENEVILINFAHCKNSEEVGKTFDVLLSLIVSNDMSELEQLQNKHVTSEVKHVKAIEAIEMFNQTVELKPNFFGLGINFNYLLQKIARTLVDREKKP